MKLNSFLAAVTFVILCSLFSSCEKEERASAFHFASWYGTYPMQELNNDTNEIEESTAYISLQFCNSGLECIVNTGIMGMIANMKRTYDVKWYSKETFTLSESNGGQTIHYYSGNINGSKMSFEFLSCDKVERTIVLEKIIYE